VTKAAFLLVAFIVGTVTSGANAQEPPSYQDNGRDIAAKMRNNDKLAMLAQLRAVDWIESEAKIIDGQPHRIATYRVYLVVNRPFCILTRNAQGLLLIHDLKLCINTPTFLPGQNFEPVVQSIWKLTDQGWRLIQQQTVLVFPP